MEILGYILSLLIGISLGLVGSGGSILSVPILVYCFAVSPQTATTHSLFIVGVTSIIATYKHYHSGNLNPTPALLFGLPSLIILLLTRRYILPSIPEIIFRSTTFTLEKHSLLMVVFSILMIGSAVSMISKHHNAKSCTTSNIKLVLAGIGVGAITGLLGASGGFLIVPVLLFYGRLPLKNAMATSLFIITVNSLIGFAADVVNGVHFNKMLLLKISGIAIAGMLAGMSISGKMNGEKLKPVFGWFVLGMALLIILKEVFHL